jgi:MoaA/NifB/PqqE/SkfB family radical SAM enzyme/membrane protein YqaA with SNARE-associated domain
MQSEPEKQFEIMTAKTYAFGAAIVAIGVAGVYMMMAKPNVHPFWTIFLYSIPSNSAISIFPHEPVLIWYGKTVNLWHLTIAATLGTLLSGYLDYKFFAPVLNLAYSAKYKASKTYQRGHYWFYKAPFVSIIVAGFTPIPFFVFKFMVCASKYPLWKYLTAVAIGRFPRYYLLALAGFALQIPNWIIFGSFAAMILMIYHRKILGGIKRFFIVSYRFVRYGQFNTGEKMSKNISTAMAVRIAARTAKNMILRRPLCIALEITHNCTANCHHCDKGPSVEDNPVGAAEYKKICDDLAPGMIQIAGGEPLIRKDLREIVRALYRPNRPPFLVLISNASLLTVEKYHNLRKAGIRHYSISLDFPDERHDENRRIPGLFKHLSQLIPELMSFGHNDVAINTCITRQNYPHLKEIARVVESWGAKLNFSVYTALRTHDDSFTLRHPEDTVKLRAIIDDFYNPAKGFTSVMTSPRVFDRYCQYFENGSYMPNCRAGWKSLVVNPDGRLTPCAMIIDERYDSRKELIEKFAKSNDCGGCFVSIRANTEKTAWQLFSDNLRAMRLSSSPGNSAEKTTPIARYGDQSKVKAIPK